MTLGTVATAREEAPVFLPVGEEAIFGVHTRPTPAVPANGTAVVVLPGPGLARMAYRNRFAVHLCRRLAGLGFHCLRIDYQGTGDSTGAGRAAILDRPFTDDLEAAMRWLEEQGLSKFVLVGTCYGAWTALMGAWKLPQVRGVVLLSLPSFEEDRHAARPVMSTRRLGQKIRGLFDARRRHRYISLAKSRVRALASRLRTLPGNRDGHRWVRPELLLSLEALAGREAPVLLALGARDEAYVAFRWALPKGLEEVLGNSSGLIDLEVFPGFLHGLPNLAVQGWALDLIPAWLDRHSGRLHGT